MNGTGTRHFFKGSGIINDKESAKNDRTDSIMIGDFRESALYAAYERHTRSRSIFEAIFTIISINL